MDVKLLEIRDRMTMIPVLAIRLGPRSETERWLLERGGFGLGPEEQDQYVVLLRLEEECRAAVAAYVWRGRTMPAAHQYIIDNWQHIASGDVVDVEYILGGTERPKDSDRESERS